MMRMIRIAALLLSIAKTTAVAQPADAPIRHELLLALIETASGSGIPGLRSGVASDSLPAGILSSEMSVLGSVSSTFRSATVASIALPIGVTRDTLLARVQALGFTPGQVPANRTVPSAGPNSWGPVIFCRKPFLISLSVHPRQGSDRNSQSALVVIEHTSALGTLCNPRPGAAVTVPPAGGTPAQVMRRFVHPEFGWTVDYPVSWQISERTAEVVRFSPPRSATGAAPQGTIGIHNARVERTAAEMVDAIVQLQQAQARGFKIISRRDVQLRDSTAAIELITELGQGTVGRSRRLFMVVGNVTYIIDAEGFKDTYGTLEPVFTAIIDSFRIRRE